MKVLIIGHGRHGKDTVAEIMAQHGFSFGSSSEFCAQHVVYPTMKDQYATWGDCFKDRHNHRDHWFNTIRDYNKDQPNRLTRNLLKEYDMYIGMRSAVEFKASRGLFDLVIWVKRDGLPAEASTSMELTEDMADIIIDNSGTLNDLSYKVRRLCTGLGKWRSHWLT